VTRYVVVSGFLFLRFFCPAIMSPKTFGVMDDHPDSTATRTLTLVAKMVQKCANLSLFEKGDPMTRVNNIVAEAIPMMKEYIDAVSSLPENPPPSVRPAVNLDRELASVHRFLKKFSPAMEKAALDDPERDTLQKLNTVLENLEYISQHEKIAQYPDVQKESESASSPSSTRSASSPPMSLSTSTANTT